MIIANSKTTRGALASLLSLVIVFSSGCAMFAARKTAAKITTASGANLSQVGNVEIPAHVETNQTRTEIQVSKDSQVSIVAATAETPSRVIVTNPAPSIVTQTQTVEAATAPKTIAPPSAKEQAAADGVRWFYIAGAILFLAALALAYLAHGKAAGFAFAGAFLAPVLGQLVGSAFALVAVAVAASVALALFVAWYLIKGHPEILNSARAKIEEQLNLRRLSGEDSTK